MVLLSVIVPGMQCMFMYYALPFCGTWIAVRAFSNVQFHTEYAVRQKYV